MTAADGVHRRRSRPQLCTHPSAISTGTLRSKVRLLQEKMALFWHDHFATGYSRAAGFGGAVRTKMMALEAGELPGPQGQLELFRQRCAPSPARLPGGIGTRMYRVQTGGFDTHAAQGAGAAAPAPT